MSLNEQISRVKEKLGQLQRAGITYTYSTKSRPHDYSLNPPLSISEVEQFENKFGLRLPEDYRAFLTEVGNGGGGPPLALYPLTTDMGRYFTGMDRYSEDPYPERLRQPFPLNDHLILYKECSSDGTFHTWITQSGDKETVRQMMARSEKFNEPLYSHGTLELCHWGCGMFFCLVVNGPEYGNVWMDDRTNLMGILALQKGKTDPRRIQFLDWYESWLDRSLLEISSGQHINERYSFWPSDEWWDEFKKKDQVTSDEESDPASSKQT